MGVLQIREAIPAEQRAKFKVWWAPHQSQHITVSRRANHSHRNTAQHVAAAVSAAGCADHPNLVEQPDAAFGQAPAVQGRQRERDQDARHVLYAGAPPPPPQPPPLFGARCTLLASLGALVSNLAFAVTGKLDGMPKAHIELHSIRLLVPPPPPPPPPPPRLTATHGSERQRTQPFL